MFESMCTMSDNKVTLPKKVCRPIDLLVLLKPKDPKNIVVYNYDDDEFEETEEADLDDLIEHANRVVKDGNVPYTVVDDFLYVIL